MQMMSAVSCVGVVLAGSMLAPCPTAVGYILQRACTRAVSAGTCQYVALCFAAALQLHFAAGVVAACSCIGAPLGDNALSGASSNARLAACCVHVCPCWLQQA